MTISEFKEGLETATKETATEVRRGKQCYITGDSPCYSFYIGDKLYTLNVYGREEEREAVELFHEKLL